MVGRNKFPRSISLKKRVEIDLLLKNGRRFSGNYFTLVWEPDEVTKCGIFLSKKAGKAVQRNRIKRIFREAVRLNLSKLTKTGKLAVMPKRTANEPEFELIFKDVCRVFEQVNRDG